MVYTVDTHESGVGQPGSINHTFPMLAGYHHSIGLYTSSSSSESENDENEGEFLSSDELSHYSDVSANSSPSAVNESATPAIDMKQFLVASTSDIEGSEFISTNMELWSTSESLLSPSFITIITMHHNIRVLRCYITILCRPTRLFSS